MNRKSFAQELADGFQRVYVVGDDLEGGDDGNGEECAGDSPEEPPEQHADEDGDGVELEVLTVEVGADDVVLKGGDDEVTGGDGQDVADIIERGEGNHGEHRNHHRSAEIRNKLEDDGEEAPEQGAGHLEP